MLFVESDEKKEKAEMQKLIDLDPSLKQFSDEWDKEYALRKKQRAAQKKMKI